MFRGVQRGQESLSGPYKLVVRLSHFGNHKASRSTNNALLVSFSSRDESPSGVDGALNKDLSGIGCNPWRITDIASNPTLSWYFTAFIEMPGTVFVHEQGCTHESLLQLAAFQVCDKDRWMHPVLLTILKALSLIETVYHACSMPADLTSTWALESPHKSP